MTILKPEHMVSLLPRNNLAIAWYPHLEKNLPLFDIENEFQIAAFIAQTAHESADYSRLVENLNYSAKGLIATWPKRFNAVNAQYYARNPEKIANFVYADRMGNGSVAGGGGWKYRGRGILQITGRNNYATCSKAIYGDLRLLDTPDLLATDKDAAIRSACWFWKSNGLNELASNQLINEITKKINGGMHGADERSKKYIAALKTLRS